LGAGGGGGQNQTGSAGKDKTMKFHRSDYSASAEGAFTAK
jgi:hypothetical protein